MQARRSHTTQVESDTPDRVIPAMLSHTIQDESQKPECVMQARLSQASRAENESSEADSYTLGFAAQTQARLSQTNQAEPYKAAVLSHGGEFVTRGTC